LLKVEHCNLKTDSKCRYYTALSWWTWISYFSLPKPYSHGFGADWFVKTRLFALF